ncbi:MAG: response regulator [Chloroflexi bacterium]|nr:response regulator [Chloroflexota bacterium]
MVILLIEDNRLDVELTLDAFQEAQLGDRVYVVRSGQEALSYLFGQEPYHNREIYPMPDLVLLDLKLPGLDGHEVLRQVKSAPYLKRLPVIILTSSQEHADLIRSYDSGANSYLVKPVSANGFLDVVRKIDQYWLTLNISPPIEDAGD